MPDANDHPAPTPEPADDESPSAADASAAGPSAGGDRAGGDRAGGDRPDGDPDDRPFDRIPEQPPEESDRLAQPVDIEGPPRLPFPVVGIGASAGGLEAATEFFGAMPPDSGMAFVLVQHLPPDRESLMADILSKRTAMPVAQVEDGMPVEPNHVYLIRPGHTLTIRDGALHLGATLKPRVNNRPVDDFFKSLAEEQRERAIAIIMSGMGSNGTAGAQALKAVGGVCIAQDPETAQFPSMPRHLIDQGYADFVLRPADMPEVLLRYAGHPYATGRRPLEAMMAREQQAFQEVLSVLRTRTKHDFGGYKRPTLFRRVQRRMGLNHVTQLGQYAKVLRQNPTEVSALADDLMIHVTGFFRDPHVWASLRARVIDPLVAGRADEGPVRCWVTACSSGEEAYSLAIELSESAEAAGKRLDVKIFATDMAERALAHARAGVYPGGIESEVSPERLDRFFERDGAVYRVRKELREMVVFAPQNVLQDPPFSRLDFCSCRNLLIYLEPEMQRRVLSLLHFGLREGGSLMLGTSETISGVEDLFEPVDKKHRIYRRVGPTRRASAAGFPLPKALAGGTGAGDRDAARLGGQRLTVPQMTQRALVERFAPASVVVDRDHRIVYFHGDTDRFLAMPRGEPTRELLATAREHVRGAVRTALYMATGEPSRTATARDGVVEKPDGGRARVWVTVAPLDGKAAPGFWLVSFEERAEPVAFDADGNGDAGRQASVFSGNLGLIQDELRRVREELQSTIEELQASNEELKASNEEVTSINEELQSTNEELETSKEELQSLNEELTTVNAQLSAKAEELEATSNDLTSLLASTDIAVIFLDTRLHIRRYTPKVKDLFELIPGDVGRPLSNLARKFTDPDLAADAAGVLERLVPIDRQVAGENGRWYARRALPYRTGDNRIDGVVITFVDTTDRTRAEQGLRRSEEEFRARTDAIPTMIWSSRPDGHVDYFNRWCLEYVGRTPEQIQGFGWEVLLHPDDLPAARELRRLAIETGGASETEFRVRRATDGAFRWHAVRASPVRDEHGAVARWFGTCTDIHDRRVTDEVLRRSEAQFRAVADLVPDLLWQNDPKGLTAWYNRRWLDYTGQSMEQAAGYGWMEVVHPDDRARSLATFRAAVDAGRPLEQQHRLRRADGVYRWFLVRAEPVRDAGGRIVQWFGAATDVHDQRAALEALREGEERFRMVVEGTGDFAIFLLDQDHRITTWNSAAERTLGYAEAEAVGMDAAAIFTPEDRAAGEPEKEVATAIRKRRALDERWHVRKDGTRIWASGSLSALRGPDGEVRGFVKILRDETARKRADEDRADLLLREQAARRQAEAATRLKDEFLATLSHELRTPLSAILIWSRMLHSPGITAEQKREGLDAIRTSAEAQRELIDDLLDTSRITAGKMRLDLRDTDLAAVLRAALDAVLPTARAKGVRVETDFAIDVGTVQVDPDRLRQIVWNLLSNAVKFTPAGGRVDVGVWRRGAEVEVRVADTGQGIDPAFLPHVFDPFRQADAGTTRTHGGLGLGLAIARQLVELHGGTIHADSPGEGKGSTFVVRLPLPAVAGGAAAAGGGLPAAARAGGPEPALLGARLLLVEDDPETRGALAALLGQGGAAVTAVGSADAAVAAHQAARPELIISDIGLPGTDGYAMLRQIRALDAAAGVDPVPAVALTAMARPGDRRQAIAAGFRQHIVKPVDPEHFVAALSALLGR